MAQDLSGVRVAILATDGFEQSELLEPRRALDEAGATTEVVALKRGEIKGWNHKEWGETVAVDKTVDSVDAKNFDALLLPGGVMNPDNLRMDEKAVAFVKAFFDTKKPIAAICHGAQVLAAAGVLQGKKCSCYPAVSPEVTMAGGTFADVAMTEAVVDGNLVSGPAWPAHPAWLAKFLEVLGTRIEP
jgi:protease I